MHVSRNIHIQAATVTKQDYTVFCSPVDTNGHIYWSIDWLKLHMLQLSSKHFNHFVFDIAEPRALKPDWTTLYSALIVCHKFAHVVK